MSEDNPCGEHRARIINLEQRTDKIELILDKVRTRPPVWVTLGFMALTLVIGWLLKGHVL